MKKRYICFFAFAFWMLWDLCAFAEEFYSTIPYYSTDVLKELTGYDFSGLIEAIAKGNMPLADGIADKILHIISGDITLCLKYTSAIMGFCMISSCVKGSQLSLKGNTGEISYLICYFIVAGFLLGILKTSVQLALNTSQELSGFIKMSLPAYIGIVTAGGIDFKVSQTIFLAMINVISSYAGGFMINAFMYIGILTVVSNMSAQLHISKLISLFRQTMFWILGFLLTVFAGLTALSGINATTSSGSGIKAVKYTIGRTVPLVGGFLADTVEIIMAAAKIFKGAFGTGGIIVVSIICIVPVIKLFVSGFVLKFTAGILEPFCDKRMCDTVHQMGQTITYITVSLILMTVMFILSFAVLLICGVIV